MVSNQPSLVPASQRVRGVFRDKQAVFVRYFINSVKVAYLPAVMHWNDRFGSGRNFLFDFVRINTARLVINIGKNRSCTYMKDRICSRSECHRRCDDFVPFADPGGKQSHMQSGSAGIHGNGMFGTKVFGKFLFEFHRAGPLGNPARPQSLHNFMDLSIG